MIVAITAASSFLATQLGPRLAAAGFVLRGTVRRPEAARDLPWLSEHAVADLARPRVGALFSGVDAIVHLAHDFQSGAAERNIAGTQALATQAREAGVRRQIFISSYSAHADALSEYGRTKYELERHFLGLDGAVVVRPGLVIGDGGIYARMVAAVRRLPIVPVPGGRLRVPYVSASLLARAVLAVLQRRDPAPREFNLFARDLTTLSELLACTRAHLGVRRWLLPLPATWVGAALRLAGRLRVRTPVNTDNLLGFIGNQRQVHASNLEVLQIGAETLTEAVATVAR
jgi:NADH dehydrogenase